MPHVAGTDRAERPTWLRFFKERHATLYISRRGMDAAFTGLHVNMAVPNAVEGNRYTLTRGQSQELVITTFAMMLLSIEHDGIESKKWNWMLERGVLERHTRHFSDSLAVTVKEDPEQASLIETSSVIKSPGSISPKHVHSLKPGEVMENWKVSSFSSSIKNNIGDAMLRSTTDSPISESIADEPNTPIDEHQGPYGQGSNFPVFHSQANSAYSSQEQNEHVIGEEVVEPQSNFYIKEKGQFIRRLSLRLPLLFPTPPPPPQQVFAGELQYPGQPPYPPMNGQEQPRPTPHMSIQGPPSFSSSSSACDVPNLLQTTTPHYTATYTDSASTATRRNTSISQASARSSCFPD
ncbi:hypothetical protein VNI00_014546 [Paramarasmius palmivorus]|uniref:Uncharacterized protein n=1 Tax=Paramarasmius palmivorus TaxID=297713 RepID=A0AAW0BRF4_9AGAR